MKKILLLFTILASVIAASAQYPNSGYENNVAKSSQVSSVIQGNGIVENVSVYPNPVVELLKVSFRSNRNGSATISLFNNIGKLVYSQDFEVVPGSNIISIDIRSKAIEPGVYFIQCKADKDLITRKLIVK
jgi:hypothetical protein